MARDSWPVAREGEPSGDVRSYRDLRVWQEAIGWTENVYLASRSWPVDERFGLISQVRRAAVSVASNIAEGAARRSTGEFLQFLGMARGSLAEAETQLILAQRLGFLTTSELTVLLEQTSDISRMLAGLFSSLQRRG